MNIDFTVDFVRNRMSELFPSQEYFMRMRHLVLSGNEVRKLDIGSQLLLLAEATPMVRIESASGYFDLSANTANELHYEHQGQVTLTNLSAMPNHVRFIHAIPKKK